VDPIANDDGWSAARAGDVEVLELDVGAHCVGAARQSGNGLAILARGGAREVLERDVGDVDPRWVGGTGRGVDLCGRR